VYADHAPCLHTGDQLSRRALRRIVAKGVGM
jgi:hypothetical protein